MHKICVLTLSSAVVLIPSSKCLVLLSSSIPAYPYSFSPSRMVNDRIFCIITSHMLFLVQCGIPFKIPMTPFSSLDGIDQLVLCCGSHIANVVGPKIMVLEGHVGCPSISGSCMRLDVGPALMVSCHFSKLIKEHLVVCDKSGMFDDGAIGLCDGMRGPLYHLFQWVIPISFFSFLGCGVLPDDVGQGDACYPITLPENPSIPSKVFGQFCSLIMGALGSSQLPSESCKSLMVQMAWMLGQWAGRLEISFQNISNSMLPIICLSQPFD